ncbi:MAG TPA: nucleotidyltransferase domain-containing protein, partial [Acidimicrobiales bacterium]|nr:nucleotidyltransferase domain-containing protein [Acidimicrobiales bacterium]
MEPQPVPGTTELVRFLAGTRAVRAVVLTGSRAQGRAGPDADVDLFVYADADLTDQRREVVSTLADRDAPVLVDVDPFGRGDVWRDRGDDTWMDVLYWSPGWAEEQLDRVIVRHEAQLGYSTAFWRSIATGVPLYERDGWHPTLQERARAPYPDELTDAVVGKNLPWLGGHPFSFRVQIEKAVDRGDAVSANHRLAAWLACYFDVIFAANRVLHPGEKRQIAVAEEECRRLPPGFRAGIEALLEGPDPRPHLDRLLAALGPLL